MPKDIQVLVAEYTREILIKLNEPRGSRSLSHHGVVQTSDTERVIFDASDTYTISGGSLVFRVKDEENADGWKIFLEFHTIEGNLVEFVRKGEVDRDLDPVRFVENSYRLILNREVDEEGKRIYSEFILSKHLSRQEFLLILASSQEAQDYRRRVLIVPKTKNSESNICATGKTDSFNSVFMKKLS